MPSSKLNSQPQASTETGTGAGDQRNDQRNDHRNSESFWSGIVRNGLRTVAVLSADLEGKIAGCND
ncbi:MAG: hypothetical protein WAK56_09630, partial [Candidatus Sulfotelmatobacter sp.]